MSNADVSWFVGVLLQQLANMGRAAAIYSDHRFPIEIVCPLLLVDCWFDVRPREVEEVLLDRWLT
ncbi:MULTISPECIES: hypothetical protein [Chelativorans]|jgi:hypothetical protein|uniref:hypothetical protein n=1 Tax=Chelativorans TaxID=449972 RepID=UPI001407F749|nr:MULTISPECIES: hypothetical protein [Chelativorans]